MRHIGGNGRTRNARDIYIGAKRNDRTVQTWRDNRGQQGTKVKSATSWQLRWTGKIRASRETSLRSISAADRPQAPPTALPTSRLLLPANSRISPSRINPACEVCTNDSISNERSRNLSSVLGFLLPTCAPPDLSLHPLSSPTSVLYLYFPPLAFISVPFFHLLFHSRSRTALFRFFHRSFLSTFIYSPNFFYSRTHAPRRIQDARKRGREGSDGGRIARAIM